MKALKTVQYSTGIPVKWPVSGRYTFGNCNEYEVVIADTLELRRRAWALVSKASNWIQEHIIRLLTESAEFAGCYPQQAIVG
ncbi:MAG: hypothetical protein ACOC6C_03065 [Verrucomicrobiota bacterium]